MALLAEHENTFLRNILPTLKWLIARQLTCLCSAASPLPAGTCTLRFVDFADPALTLLHCVSLFLLNRPYTLLLLVLLPLKGGALPAPTLVSLCLVRWFNSVPGSFLPFWWHHCLLVYLNTAAVCHCLSLNSLRSISPPLQRDDNRRVHRENAILFFHHSGPRGKQMTENSAELYYAKDANGYKLPDSSSKNNRTTSTFLSKNKSLWNSTFPRLFSYFLISRMNEVCP